LVNETLKTKPNKTKLNPGLVASYDIWAQVSVTIQAEIAVTNVRLMLTMSSDGILQLIFRCKSHTRRLGYIWYDYLSTENVYKLWLLQVWHGYSEWV